MAVLTRARYFAGFDRGRTHAMKVDPGENLDWQSIGSRHVVIVNEQVYFPAQFHDYTGFNRDGVSAGCCSRRGEQHRVQKNGVTA